MSQAVAAIVDEPSPATQSAPPRSSGSVVAPGPGGAYPVPDQATRDALAREREARYRERKAEKEAKKAAKSAAKDAKNPKRVARREAKAAQRAEAAERLELHRKEYREGVRRGETGPGQAGHRMNKPIEDMTNGEALSKAQGFR